MKRIAAIGLTLAVLWALPATAAELELGIDAGVAYDDHVFGGVDDPQGDTIGRVGPRFRVLDEQGSLTWNFHYRPTYERYLDLKADEWDHDLLGTVSWALSPRTRLRVTERFLDTSNVTAVFTETAGPDPFVEEILEVGSNRIRFNQLQASLDHQPTVRQAVSLFVGRYDTRYTNGLETEVTSLGLSYLYALTPLDRAGLALSAVQQDVGGGEPVYFYNGSVQWQHRFSRTLSLNASAGPAWVDRPDREFPEVLEDRSRYPLLRTSAGLAPIRASSCEPAGGGLFVLSVACEPTPPGTVFETFDFVLEAVDLPRLGDDPANDAAITYFATISLAKQWQHLSTAVAYNRGASTTSQVGGLVSDTLSLSVSWVPPARPWRTNFWVSYGRREFPGGGFTIEQLVRSSTVAGVSDVAESVGFRLIEVERNQNVDVYTVGLYVAYELTDRADAYLRVNWHREEYDFEFAGSARRFDRFRVTVGVVYTLPRINLPI